MSDCDKQKKPHSNCVQIFLQRANQSINPLSSWAPAPASAAAAATVASSSNFMLKIAVTTFNHCNKKRDIVRVGMTSDWSSWSSCLQQAHDLKLSMISHEWSTSSSILSRKSHIENCYPFNQYYNENKNERENITSIGTKTEGGEIEALQAHNLVQFSQQNLMLKIATNEERMKLFKLIILLNSLKKISCWK